MKKIFIFKFLILVILTNSCKDEVIVYTLDNYITAGQKNGYNIEYTNLEPDINCMIIDPWIKTDTTIVLDLNNDSILDFEIKGSMCDPAMLGADCEYLGIKPLNNNGVCVNQTGCLDTIPYLGTIDIFHNWSNEESIIHSYYGDMNGYSSYSGNWKSVLEADKYYIGFMIEKNKKQYFGWMGMRFDSDYYPYNFLISDYAILKEYPQ